MPNTKLNTTLIWKQVEDVVVPTLRLSLIDRVVYWHLLRHSHLEGRDRLHFSIPALAQGAGLSPQPTRRAVRRLASSGVLRLVQCTRAGHIAEVRLPSEIPAVSLCGAPAKATICPRGQSHLEDLDFLQNKALRESLHAREHGFCFYCLRRVTAPMRCLDHVLCQAKSGSNSYRNLVSCCVECNSQKQDKSAADFLRGLYRERRLNAAELQARLQALDDLAAGKLRPIVPRNSLLRTTRNSPGRVPRKNPSGVNAGTRPIR